MNFRPLLLKRRSLSLPASLWMALILCALFSFCLLPVQVSANSPGDLDASFGFNGKVTDTFEPTRDNSATAMVIQPDGKIVLVGTTLGSGSPGMIRFNPDGTRDLFQLITAPGDLYTPNAVALQPDAKIVIAGTYNGQDFWLKRYNPNGSEDQTFGHDGVVTTDFNNGSDRANAMALEPDGKIVLAGQSTLGGVSGFALARYNANGMLDQTFGSFGKVVTPFNSSNDRAMAVVIQPDGKIIAAGVAEMPARGLAMARYNLDGTLDQSFGASGKVTSSSQDSAKAISLQPDGKIVAVGTGFNVSRYNSNGMLDSGFGVGGMTTVSFDGHTSTSTSLALQPDGKIVLAGNSSDSTDPAPADPFFALARLDSNGALDNSFGTGGRATTIFPTLFPNIVNPGSDSSTANAVAIQADGKIVAAGRAREFNPIGQRKFRFAMARYLTTPNPNTVQFSSDTFTASEESHAATITVTRSGDTSQSATVDYRTRDYTASQMTHYTLAAGTLTFTPGQISQSFDVLLTDDAYSNGFEKLTITLSNPTGGVDLAVPAITFLTITDNDSPGPLTTNPIDDPQQFVRQHYHDLLAREADPAGLAYWTNQITACGTDPQCIQQRRVAVSDAFFFETEYQDTAAFVYRLYKASYGMPPAYFQFMPDRSRIVGGSNLSANKSAFIDLFIQRTAFLSQYPLSLTPEQFVGQLNTNTGNSVTTAERDALVQGLKDRTETRASVLRKIVDAQAFIEREYNNSFILTLYFSYLRRDPDAGGFDFWFNQINKFPLRDIKGQHALVCSFITSTEYQFRFSYVATHNNRECN